MLPDELEEFRCIDSIPPWPEFQTAVREAFKEMCVCLIGDNLCLHQLDQSGDVYIKINISPSFTLECSKYHSPVNVRDILGFQQNLKYWSQLNEVIVRCRNATVSVKHEITHSVQSLMNIFNAECIDSLDSTSKFLMNQLLMSQTAPTKRSYDGSTIRQCGLIYLISSSAYQQIRTLLPLPHPRTLRTHLGALGEVGTELDCIEMIRVQFQQLSGCQKLCILLFDEMYIKPSMRYRNQHVIGQSLDRNDKMARTVLAIMVKPLMGGQAFVIRLLPVYSLSPQFLQENISRCIGAIDSFGGRVIALVSDNHPTNRKCFAEFSKKSESLKPWIGKDHSQEHEFFLIHDSVHLIKCIRNNWETEKTKVIDFIPPNRSDSVSASWSDIVALYKSEEQNVVRRTNLSHESVYPTNIQKTNVNLALQVFDEKVVAALNVDGKSETAIFVEHIVKLWKRLNCKNPILHVQLNDPDRQPIRSTNDEGLAFLSSMADSFANSEPGKGRARTRSLTTETNFALVNSLRGLVEVSKLLLNEFPFKYVLLAEFQSDPLEAEFGVYRQMSGGNYFLSVEQVLLSARLRRMKLNTALELAEQYKHETSVCCKLELNDDELTAVDTCIFDVDELSSEETATLFYIAGE